MTMNEVQRVIDYMGDQCYEALYLYMDIQKYGVDSEHVTTWLQYKMEKISCVILKYHTGMHVFSKEKNAELEEICDLILREKPTMICAEATIIQQLGMFLDGEYRLEIGHVAQYTNAGFLEKCVIDYKIERALEKDYHEMALMLLEDEDIGGSYDVKELENQISERIKEGYSRSYCIKLDNKIVAQISTGAEYETIATIALVMVDFRCRGRGLATSLVKRVCYELTQEGKDVYLVYYSSDAGRVYLKNGFKNVCDYGKLYRRI